jgi:hypothetical protein
LATVLNNENMTGASKSMSDNLFNPPSWWTEAAPRLNLTNVETIREADGIYGNDAMWQKGKKAGRYTVIMTKVV